MGGFVDERVLDVAEVQELVLAVAAFAVVSGEASAGTKRFTRLATRSAAAWALKTCPVVVYVTDDQFPLLPMLGRLAAKLCSVDDRRNWPGGSVRCGSGEGNPGGGSVEDGASVRSFGSHSERGITLPAGPHQCGRLRSG